MVAPRRARPSIVHQRLRVEAVVPESPATVSLYLGGPQVANVRAEAGQFFMLRVLKPGLLVLIGAGIGIAPLRAILETLDRDAAPVVLFRARKNDDLVTWAS